MSLLFLLAIAVPALAQRASREKFHYGFEMNGNLVGYLEMEVVRGEETVISSQMTALVSLLGQGFDLKSEAECRIDAATGRVLHYRQALNLGDIEQGCTVAVEPGKAVFTSRSTGETRTVETGPEVVFDNTLYFNYLLEEVPREGEKTFQQFSYELGEIHEVSFTRAGEDGFEWIDRKLGARGKLVLDPVSGRFLRMEQPGTGIVIYAADAEVAEQIKRAELDDTLFARVEMPYADYRSLTYMKVKARINTLGEWVTPESLNVRGQKFTGTVEENLIDGTFEIRQIPYDGTSAPDFPMPRDEKLKRYLEPEELIESDDPVLAALAKDLTLGLKNAWDAVRILSQWVETEIAYKIPGGSARQTHDSRTGECGSQSRLLIALCRASGIPARAACGCMFTPFFGGSFGQHTWVEVYMGRAGWISLDPTAKESDRIDSGHIRLGSRASFNPVAMEVLDFAAGASSSGKTAAPGAFDTMPWEVGKAFTYTYAFEGRVMGNDAFTLLSVGEEGIHGKTELALMGRTTSTEWKVDGKGRPLMYRLEGKSGTVSYSIDCAFDGDEVVEKVLQAGQPFERTIKLPERVYLLDNNNFGLFAVLAATLPLEEGAAFSIKVFHPASMQVMPLKISVERREPVSFQGEEVDCWLCSFDLDGTPLKLWIDGKGRTLKETEQGGRLVVTLTSGI